MGKRRRHTPTRVTRTVDTGILRTTSTTYQADDRDGIDAALLTAGEASRAAFDWENVVQQASQRGEWIIAHRDAPDWPAEVGDRDGCAHDANDLLAYLRQIPHYATIDQPRMLAFAFWAGAMYERLSHVRPYETAVMKHREKRATLAGGREIRRQRSAERRDALRKEALDAVAAAEQELRKEGKSPEHMREVVLRRAAKLIRSPQSADKGITVRALRNRLKTS